MNKKEKKNKKGQVTIFIIIAILIVLVIFVLFYSDIKMLISEPEPVDQLRGCVKDAVDEVFENISLQGGTLNPENYFLYQGDKIEYLCYTNEYYKSCVMQKPLITQGVEKEIKDYISPKVEQCLGNLKISLEGKGYRVDSNFEGVDVRLVPERITIDTKSNLVITKESVVRYKNIKTELPTGLYNLLMISSSIANWETRYGDSDPMGFMGFYPNLKVEKKKQGEGTKIYILTNTMTKEKFQFASRSYVQPPGYFG